MPPRRVRLSLSVLFGVAALAAALSSCRRGGSADDATRASGDNLVAARAPHKTKGVRDARRLTDGVASYAGDAWRTDVTAVFRTTSSYVEYDLGQVVPVDAIWLQGDNNDVYRVSGSTDGDEMVTLWDAPADPRPGIRPRYVSGLHASVRYLRVQPVSGDGSFSLTEVRVYSSVPPEWPPHVILKHGQPQDEALYSTITLFGLALILFLVVHRRGSWWWNATGLLPLAAGIKLIIELAALWPVGERQISLLRAVAGAAAAFAIIRQGFGPKREAADRRVITGSLAVLATLAVACYYNLFAPQFPDQKSGERTVVHTFDMRNYYPVAKYFPEVRFDGAYLACVQAYVEEMPRGTELAIRNYTIRDLRTHQIRRIGEILPDALAVKARFSPERWDQFKRDMRYFWETMGRDDYINSMNDHGGNATPVWILAAHSVLRWTPASDASLIASALIDPLLLILLFVTIARTFGVQTMLVSLIVFGANNFYMFGSNLVGSTLRYDWMVALGLGACALRRERWVLGGALIAYGGLIRAFPAVAGLFLVVPTLWWLVEWRRSTGAWPAFADWRQHQRGLARAILGATITVVVLVAVSSLVFGFRGTWDAWLHKVSMLSRDPHVNHIGLRTIFGFNGTGGDWQEAQRFALSGRAPYLMLTAAALLGVTLAAARRRRLDQAAMLGMFLVPVIFYPANYYYHYVFLLPLVAAGQGQQRPGAAWVSAVFLMLCAAQFPALFGPLDVRFFVEAVLLVMSYALVLVPLAHEALTEGRASPKPAPAAPALPAG